MTTEKSPQEQVEDAAHTISQALDADVLLFCGSMYWPEERAISNRLRQFSGKAPNLFVMAGTLGGSAEVAFRVARRIRSAYQSFTLFVPTLCKSAGTLLAIGADQIVMAERGELGPLDVQLLHSDIADRTSGLTPIQALHTLASEIGTSFEEVFLHIRKKTRLGSEAAAKVAGQIVTGVYARIYNKLDPVRIGENERAMAIAKEYGERLAAGRHVLTPKALDRLVSSYPSHEFCIDLQEALKLFTRIRKANKKEMVLADLLVPRMEESLSDDEESESLVWMIPKADATTEGSAESPGPSTDTANEQQPPPEPSSNGLPEEDGRKNRRVRQGSSGAQSKL
jgi:Serine dehydrogenase proteinase